MIRELVRAYRLPLAPGLADAIADAIAGGLAPADAPGLVYERSLEPDRRARRAAGVYYTPHHLVDLVVERALGPALAGRTPAQALRLRVVDPACGGGAFLLAALRRIERHVVERGARAGPALRREIALRCLVGADLDPAAAAAAKLALLLEIGPAAELTARALASAVRTGDALADDGPLANVEADAVIGNPPWGQKSFRFDAGDRDRLRRRYVTATGVLDPFKLFVERALEIAAVGGRWGLVLPDIILLKNQRPVRELVLDRSAIEWIVDAGRAFPGVNLDAVAIVARHTGESAPADHRVSIWHELPPDWRERPPPARETRQRLFSSLPDKKLNIHITERDMDVVRALDRAPRVGDRFAIHEGVHSGNVRAKLFRDRRPRGPAGRLVVGKQEIGRYRLTWGGRWIDRSPGLVDRAAGEYANLGRPEWHEPAKIVVRRTGDRIVAARDDGGHWVSNNLFVLLSRSPAGIADLRAWVGVLNSTLVTWLFRTLQPRTGRLFAELKIHHLAALPAPAPDRWGARAGELAGIVASLETAAARRGPRRGAAPSDLDRAVDELVYDLYELSTGDRRHVAGG